MTASVSLRPSGNGLVRLVFAERPGNVISLALVHELRQALARVRADPRLKLIALEGDGRDFSFGASVPEHLPGAIDRVLPDTHALLRDLLAAPAPTLAIVHGRCLGGGFELALACDVIAAADDAVMGLPEIALGVFPPAGAVLLPLRVGAARAAHAVLTGAPRSGREWFDAGLAAIAAPGDQLDAVVDRWFSSYLAPRSAAALRHAAEASRLHVRALAEPALERAERLYLDSVMQTHDAVEGVTAFLEKRRPQWQDR